MPQKPVRTSRIEARIAPDALKVIKRAAEIQGRSVSDFVVAAAQEVATRQLRTRKSFAFQSRISAPSRKQSLIRHRRPSVCGKPPKLIELSSRRRGDGGLQY